MYAELGRPQRCVHATAGLADKYGIDALITAHAPEIPSMGGSGGAHAANASVTTIPASQAATASPVGSSTSAAPASCDAGDTRAAAVAAGMCEFALLSIDVDGIDYWLWDAVRVHAPSVVIIEHNPTVPNHVLFVSGALLMVVVF